MRRRIIHEMERISTLDQREVELRAFAMTAHKESERAMRAAAELGSRRTAAGDAERPALAPPPGLPQRAAPPIQPKYPSGNELPPPARPRWPRGVTFMANTRFNPLDSG